jgi:hypothetical protein
MNATIEETTTDTSATAAQQAAPVLSDPSGDINADWPMPADPEQVFEAYNRSYRFCVHCHTPKPVAQIRATDSALYPGVCATCYNGLLNYDRLTRLDLIPARPDFVAPAPKAPKAPKEPKAAKEPKLIKITLADGTIVEGQAVKQPRAPKAAAGSNGALEEGAAATTETPAPKKGRKNGATAAPAEASGEAVVETTNPA